MRGRGIRQGRLGGLLILGALVLVACGEPAPRFETLPSTTIVRPTTTTRPKTTTPTTRPRPSTTTSSTLPKVEGPWIPAATNLTGMPSECGNLSLVSARPDRDMVITSVAQRGLFASENGAETWSPLGTGPGSATITNRGSSIVYDPVDPNRFWQSGIYNGGGVYRTDDNGLTFRQLGNFANSDAVSVDLSDPFRRTLLASSHERRTLLRSTDGGATWVDIAAGLPENVGFASQPYVIDGQTHLVGTNSGTDAGVYRTTDGGQTWTQAYKGDVAGAPLAAKDGTLYWVRAPYGGIIKSTDGGVSWLQASRDGTVNFQAPYLVELPDGRLAAAGSRSVIISSDKGARWRAIGPGMPISPTGFTYAPFRKAFYIWWFTCAREGENPVLDNSIMRLDFDYATQ